jgi:hypothetical protein
MSSSAVVDVVRCKPSDFKFGVTRVRGVYASPNNPQRDGVFVEHIRRTGRMNPGQYVRLTDGKGRFWMYDIDAVVIWRDGESEEEVTRRADELYQQIRPR